METIKIIFLLTGIMCFISATLIHIVQLTRMINENVNHSKIKKILNDNFAKIADHLVDEKENSPKAKA